MARDTGNGGNGGREPEAAAAGANNAIARRFGLSAKLLVLTSAFVMLAEVLIFVPSIANLRVSWLMDRLTAAQLAAKFQAQEGQLTRGLVIAPANGTVLLTAARSETSETLAAYASMGFPRHEIIDLPV